MTKYKVYGYFWTNTRNRKAWKKRRVQRTLIFKNPSYTFAEIEIEFKKILGEDVILQGFYIVW